VSVFEFFGSVPLWLGVFILLLEGAGAALYAFALDALLPRGGRA
jgi:hypothetical protein